MAAPELAVLSLASDADWGDEPEELELRPVPTERIRPHFMSRRLFRTSGRRQARRFQVLAPRLRSRDRAPRSRRTVIELVLGHRPEILTYHHI